MGKHKAILDKFYELANHIAAEDYNMNDKSKIMNVKTATIVLGVIPGYTNNPLPDTMDETVETTIVSLIEKYYKMTGVPLSFTVTPAKVCYREIWSHRMDGEPVYILEAVQNKNFPEQRNTKLWMKVVECIASDLKNQFKQSTVTIQYSDKEVVYLTERKVTSGDIQN